MSDSGHFVDQFIDDYFAECDEHLATVRRVLLILDSATASTPATELHDLSRALHTIKGLSGMVGLASAEQVAHAMEDGVRAITNSSHVSADLLEALFDGVALLDACITARRDNKIAPPTDAFVAQVLAAIPSAQRAAPGGWDVAVVAQPGMVPEAGLNQRFLFTPSAAAAARGVGVEAIRARLQTLGEIIAAIPVVLPGGALVFEFTVALRAGAIPSEQWRADGLSWQTLEVPATVVSNAIVSAPAGGRRVSADAPSVVHVSNVVRVDLTRLDDLMRMIGELVVSRSRLDETLEHVTARSSADALERVHEVNTVIERQLRALREGITRIRLVPIGEVFERMRFAMRDIARDTGKSIRLEFIGQDTEIDKLVVDRMLEPLLHLVRNAASHGIESAAERVRAGKSAEGCIALRARAAGDRIVLEVEDDGGGLDVDRVRERATALGLVRRDESVTGETLLDVLCAPGFSTRDSADMASGRGIGMAVVRTTIRGLGGDLVVDSTRGHGTLFTIELPLTLMITDALLVEVGGQSMAVPQLVLREIIQLDPATVTHLENNDVMTYRAAVLPLVSLRRSFNFEEADDSVRQHVLVVGGNAQLTGLIVDRVVGLREIVIHPIADPLVAVPGVAGATELADGRVSLILDTAVLARRVRTSASSNRGAGNTAHGRRQSAVAGD